MDCCQVFEKEWVRLIDSLLEQGILIQCFYASEDMMPSDMRRVVFTGHPKHTFPVEVAPWLMLGKYAFEAFRNEAVDVEHSRVRERSDRTTGDSERREESTDAGSRDCDERVLERDDSRSCCQD